MSYLIERKQEVEQITSSKCGYKRFEWWLEKIPLNLFSHQFSVMFMAGHYCPSALAKTDAEQFVFVQQAQSIWQSVLNFQGLPRGLSR